MPDRRAARVATERGRTDYVQLEDVERIKSEIANYRKLKELCERFVALLIEESKRKTEQRRKADAAGHSRSSVGTPRQIHRTHPGVECGELRRCARP